MDKLFRIDFYPKDWLFDTSRLSPEERGVYIQIVCLIYSNRGPVENDAAWIAGVSGCSSRKVKSIISSLIQKKFLSEKGTKLTQKRAEYELNNKRTHLENSSKGGRKKAENDTDDRENSDLASSEDDNPQPTPTASPSPSPSPKAKVKEKTSVEPSAPELQMAVSVYNEIAKEYGLSLCQTLSDARKSKIKQRLKSCGGLEGWRAAMEKIRGNDFLTGRGERGWKPNIDFFLQEQSFIKLMEGFYDEQRKPKPKPGTAEYNKQQLQAWVDGK